MTPLTAPAAPTPAGHSCLRAPAPGGRLAVYESGSGPPVVLVHGGTSTAATDFAPVLPLLTHRFRVVMFDLRGHGASTGFAEGLGVDRFGFDVLHVMRQAGLGSAGMVGFSVGGNALLRLVARHPGVARALVTIGASSAGRPDAVARIREGLWLPELVELSHVDAQDADHWRRIRDQLSQDWANTHRVSPAQAGRITCPTLLVHGELDRVEPVSEARTLAARLPRARLELVPEAGHMAQVDRPDLVGPMITDFLAATLSHPRGDARDT